MGLEQGQATTACAHVQVGLQAALAGWPSRCGLGCTQQAPALVDFSTRTAAACVHPEEPLGHSWAPGLQLQWLACWWLAEYLCSELITRTVTGSRME